MRVEIHGITLEIKQGDIARQKDVEVVANAAHAGYLPEGGVSTAIFENAGSGLAEHAKLLSPLRPGQAVLTPAFNLPNKCIIHCFGPPYGGSKQSDKQLAECYLNALKLADLHELSTIAFPAISAGGLGYPIREAANIALNAVIDAAHTLKTVKLIRFVLISGDSMDVFQNIFVKLVWNKRIPTTELNLH